MHRPTLPHCRGLLETGRLPPSETRESNLTKIAFLGLGLHWNVFAREMWGICVLDSTGEISLHWLQENRQNMQKQWTVDKKAKVLCIHYIYCIDLHMSHFPGEGFIVGIIEWYPDYVWWLLFKQLLNQFAFENRSYTKYSLHFHWKNNAVQVFELLRYCLSMWEKHI